MNDRSLSTQWSITGPQMKGTLTHGRHGRSPRTSGSVTEAGQVPTGPALHESTRLTPLAGPSHRDDDCQGPGLEEGRGRSCLMRTE